MTRAAWRLAGVIALAATACASSGSNEGAREPGAGAGAGGWWCHNEQGPNGRIASQCRPDRDACEGERGAAQASGLASSECGQVPQVACFQLAGDPAPAAAWCAASLEDCDFWRGLDEQKNGPAGQHCDWQR